MSNPSTQDADRRRQRRRPSRPNGQLWQNWGNLLASFAPLLDVLAMLAWGALCWKYWLQGKLFLLIHPNNMTLSIIAGTVLLILGGTKAVLMERNQRQRRRSSQQDDSTTHISLFPPGWSSLLLVAAALLGLLVEPRAFSSQTAFDRGVTETLTMTRVKPQAFRASTRSQDKSIIDWVRTLNVYPEPDAYTGQQVKVQGFVVHPPGWPDRYLMISRFIITCCAADVYPVGLPVKLSQSRSAYPVDQWFEVAGEMITETIGDKRQLVIQAQAWKSIPQPANPYDY